MIRSFLPEILLLVLLFFFVSPKGHAQPDRDSPPNLVIILADDLGYADVGFNGSEDIPTPHIDRIADKGVQFTNAYVSYAVCGPSRAGLITGRYQDRFGFSRNPLFAPNDPDMGLPLSEETLADALKKGGYRSAVFGKWHLGAHPTQRPLERGFDYFYGFLSGGHRYFPEDWTLPDEYAARKQYDGYRTKLLRNEKRVEETEYITDALSREAVERIEKWQDHSFFLYVAYNAPHGPLQATEKYLARFPDIADKKRKTYAAMVSALDDGVGRILDKLEELDLTDNTIVVFLSDNGGPEQANASNNGILRAGKGTLFEGGVRVPFAMQWPGRIPAGMKFDHPVISLDIFATIVAQNQPAVTTRNPLDGVDLMPFLTGEQEGAPHEMLFWRKYDQKEYAIRKGDQKLILKGAEPEGLYNLQQDVSEEKDLSAENAEVLRRLEELLQEWETGLTTPVFMGLLQDKEYDRSHPHRFKRPN